jgi:hypothetical protein
VRELDAGHLPNRVDPGIGSSRAHDHDRGPLNLGKRSLETLLNRRPVLLPLPADVGGAFVGDGELQAQAPDLEPGFETGSPRAHIGHTADS